MFSRPQSHRGKNYLPTICLWLLVIILMPQVTMGQINSNKIKQSYSFIENKGQWDSDVLFLAKSNSLRVWITKKTMVIEQFEATNTKSLRENSILGLWCIEWLYFSKNWKYSTIRYLLFN
jgi:hypothetical protein